MTDDAADKALMRRFQDDGACDAFEALFHRHRDALYRFLLRLSGNETVAEDVSQNAWLKVVELASRGGYRGDTAATFRTFLFTLARNHYIDQFIRKHEVARTESLDPGYEPVARDAGGAGEEALQAQLRRHMYDALAVLPFEQREVITLWATEFTTEQIVSVTGAPRDTVLSRRKYALKKLRRFFEERGVSRDG